MTFDEILTRVITLLQQEGRVSYRALKIRFNLDDEYLEGLKDELIEAKQLAADERGKVLVWTGEGETGKRGKTVQSLASRAEWGQSTYLALLAEAHGKAGQTEEGLTTLAEALAVVDSSGERRWEAEL